MVAPQFFGNYSRTYFNDSKLTIAVKKWVEDHELTDDIRANTSKYISGIELSKAKNQYKVSVDGAWLHGYKETVVSKDCAYIYEQRYPLSSPAIQILNRFTRVDGLSYFTSSRQKLSNPAPNTPAVTVFVAIAVTLNSKGKNILNNIGLKITVDGVG